MNSGVVTLTVVCMVYAISSVVAIELKNNRKMVPAAAFGPALVVLGPDLYGVAEYYELILGALVLECVAASVFRRSLLMAVWHGVLLVVCVMVFWAGSVLIGGSEFSANRPLPVLIAVGVGVAVYFLGDIMPRVRKWSVDVKVSLWKELEAAVPLLVVMLSTCGLNVLVFGDLGWVGFALLLLPMLVVQREFARFGEARRTYTQTVRGLGRLTERGGYVPEGHHERVAQLVVAMGNEVGVRGERLDGLQLVALLHDVGSVSLPEPEDVLTVGPDAIIRNTMRILEETGYLAPYAYVLGGLGNGDGEAPLEARILRVANEFDERNRECMDPVGRLRRSCPPGDEEIVEALARVTRSEG